MKLTHANQRDMALRNMDSIESQMPIIFENGCKIESIEASCSCCQNEINPSELTGSIVSMNPDLTVVEAIGYCKPCNLLTRLLLRTYSDLRITSPTNGLWQEFTAKSSIKDKLLDIFLPNKKTSSKKMRP